MWWFSVWPVTDINQIKVWLTCDACHKDVSPYPVCLTMLMMCWKWAKRNHSPPAVYSNQYFCPHLQRRQIGNMVSTKLNLEAQYPMHQVDFKGRYVRRTGCQRLSSLSYATYLTFYCLVMMKTTSELFPDRSLCFCRKKVFFPPFIW